MSVQTEIERISQNVANTYAVLEAMGCEMPSEQNSDNLAPTAGTSKVVRYDVQNLTEEQQEQVRANIGAASMTEFSALSEQIADQITPSIPEYWQSAYDEAVAKVKALQDAGGKDVVNFLWFSDMHYTPSSTHIKNIGTLCANLMKDLNIPLVLNTGDMMTNGTLNGANDVISYMNEAQDLLSAIPWEMFAYIYGNHDDVYGSYTDGSQTVYYVNKVAPQKMWNSVHRKYARDFKRVYGEHGTYFYIDNIPQKTRFICLNSHFYDGEEITSGTTKYMTTRFGTEQLEWLGNVALNMESDWNNIIAVHVPPTASTINGNTYYLSQYSDGANFRSIIENSTANIIAIVCGHCHADAVVSDDLRCPIITITCAGNFSYASDSEGTRTVGTSTETAIDIVSINKKTSVIYTTRLGVGSDRICSYTGEKIATYSITRNLTGCTSSSSTTVIEEGKTYIETITAIEGYTLDNATVSVTMDGVDISSNYVNGVLTIDSVTGDIVITVTAVEEEQTEPSYTNLFNADNVLLNARSNSSNTIVTANGNFITEWNPLPNDYITEECFLYLKGINPTGGTASSYSKLLFNDAVSDSAVGVGNTIDNVLQFSLTTNAGVNWETLDADELYYKIDLRRVATGELTGAINYSKSFALVLNISSSALTLESLPDIIMSFEPIS